MELNHVLTKPRIRITMTRTDNDINHAPYLNARIVRLDKIETKIRKMKKQSKANAGHKHRIKILKPSNHQTKKNTRRNETTMAKSLPKGRDKKLSLRKEKKRRKHSKEIDRNKNYLDFDTNEYDYQILRNTGEHQMRSTKTSNAHNNYEHLKSEIIRDGSSHWIGSKNFSTSQSNNKLTEITLFKILNKKSIFGKFLLSILPIKKVNPKNQSTFPTKYNKRKRNKKRKPRLKNSMERFIHKYILNKNSGERDETQMNKYEPLVSTNSKDKSYETRYVSTSPPTLTDLNFNEVSDSLLKSQTLYNNEICDIGKTESEELFLPLSCLINEAKKINRNSFDLIQSTLKKPNWDELTINHKEISGQKLDKASILQKYHLISSSDLDVTSYHNHNLDGNCNKCDKILNYLLSNKQIINSDENNSQENKSSIQKDRVSDNHLSDCLPSNKHNKDNKKSTYKQNINDDLNINSVNPIKYKRLNAQVGIPMFGEITNCEHCQNSNRNSSTNVSEIYNHKSQQKSSSLDVNKSSNDSMVYTASILDYENYKSSRYMMVHCNDCDLICIVEPIENY